MLASVLLILGQLTMAQTPLPSCEQKFKSYAATAREQTILDQSKGSLQSSNLLNCGRDSLGAFVVAIHEGVHTMDTGPGTKFYTSEGTSLEFDRLQLPAPRDVLKEHLARSGNQPSDMFNFMYKNYLVDRNTLAARDFLPGLTELNAYTHGVLTALALEEKNPGRAQRALNSQRTGLLFFLISTKTYLKELLDKHPEAHAKLMANAKNSAAIDKLMALAMGALRKSNFCQSKEPGETELRNDAQKILGDNLGCAGAVGPAVESSAAR